MEKEDPSEGVNWILLQDRMMDYEASCAVEVEELFEKMVAEGLTIYSALGIFQTVVNNESNNLCFVDEEEEEGE